MTEPVSINPEGLRNAANQFDDISDTTRQILNTLTGGCSAEGEPWGDDKAGKKFSEGTQGYLANRDGTFKSLGQLVDLFGQNRDNLRDSAKTFEQNESQVTNSTPSGSGSTSGSGSGSSGSGSSSSGSSSTTYYTATRRLDALRSQLQPREYLAATEATPAEYGETPQQPLLARERTQETPVEYGQTQPRLYEAAQSIPGTPLQPREYSREVPATEGTPMVYGQTQPRLYEATEGTPETPLQPREYSREIPATERTPVVYGQTTPEQPLLAREEIPATETYRAVEEQPLQSQEAFPRIQAQPVQNPNQA